MKRAPFIVALLPIIVMALVMGIGFGKYRLSVEVLLLVVSFFTVGLGLLYGTTWDAIAASVSEKVGKSFMPIFIFVFVGMMIGTWMLSGTIPMLIYYGLKILSPSMFFVTSFIITVIVSLCTGTSFGCVGTVGLALIGVAHGLGLNLSVAAGAIISGAYFGDKMSPLSDTTNLAPVAAGTTLFEHIRSMVVTTLPSAVCCLIVYFIVGRMESVVGTFDSSAAVEMMEGIADIYNFNILLLLPLVIVLVGSVMGKPTIPVMFVASVAGGVLAIIFQGATVMNAITAAFSGFKLNMITGIDTATVSPSIINLVQRGGMTSMMTTILKVLCAFLFAGGMTASGFMDVLLENMKKYIHSDGTLILVTVICTAIVSIVVGNVYVPILLCGEMFQSTFKERNLSPTVLSRTLEDSCTVVVPMVPWSSGGAYMAGTLGVETFDYLPWAVFLYSGMIFAVIFGFTGFGMYKLKPEESKFN